MPGSTINTIILNQPTPISLSFQCSMNKIINWPSSPIPSPKTKWDHLISSRAHPLSISSTGFSETAAQLFAFNDLTGEFLNPFEKADRMERDEVGLVFKDDFGIQDAIQAMNELMDGIPGWECLSDCVLEERRDSGMISPKMKVEEWWTNADMRVRDHWDSPTLGYQQQMKVRILPWVECSRELDVSRWSVSSDDLSSVYSFTSPLLDKPLSVNSIAAYSFWNDNKENDEDEIQGFSPVEIMSFNTVNAYQAEDLVGFASVSALDKFLQVLQDIEYIFNTPLAESFGTLDIEALTVEPNLDTEFHAFFGPLDVENLVNDLANDSYTFVNHDIIKDDPDFFILMPHPPCGECSCYHCGRDLENPVRAKMHDVEEWCHCFSCQVFRESLEREDHYGLVEVAKMIRWEAIVEGNLGCLDAMDFSYEES